MGQALYEDLEIIKENKESSAIQTHINILQNIISRMANNSANSKTWAITIVSAIIVLLVDKSKTDILYIAFIPLIMFFFLDCLYLGLEKYFRCIYNEFVKSLESEGFSFKNAYKLNGPKKLSEKIKYTFLGIWSFSTIPFYLVLGLMIYIISKIS